MNPKFTETWLLRCRDLVDQYRPDLLYFDNIGDLPLGQAGLDIAAHFYNSSLQWHGGKLEVVLNVKGLDEARRPALVEGNCLGTSKSSHGFHELHGFCMMTLLVHVGSMGQLQVFLRGFSVKSVAAFCF